MHDITLALSVLGSKCAKDAFLISYSITMSGQLLLFLDPSYWSQSLVDSSGRSPFAPAKPSSMRFLNFGHWVGCVSNRLDQAVIFKHYELKLADIIKLAARAVS